VLNLTLNLAMFHLPFSLLIPQKNKYSFDLRKVLLLIIVSFVFNISQVFSQSNALSFVIEDQYGTKIKEAKVVVKNTNKFCVTAKDGIATIDATSTDSVVIEKKHFSPDVIAVSNIKNNTLTIQKGFSWSDLINPKFYIIHGGLWLLLFVVFAETGLFAGFFLPGDSLLFVAGIYNKELVTTYFPFVQNEYMQLLLLWLIISAAGIIGNSVGYWFGKKVGPAMYGWKENILFKKKYLEQAHEFYEKHGGGAIVFARFLPIIRTFAPIVAGIVAMDKKKFTFFNILGCLAWVFSMLFAGHFLQKWIWSQFHFDLKEHLELIVIGIVLITTAPIILKLVMGKKK
jgi:membrane-associated protein